METVLFPLTTSRGAVFQQLCCNGTEKQVDVSHTSLYSSPYMHV